MDPLEGSDPEGRAPACVERAQTARPVGRSRGSRPAPGRSRRAAIRRSGELVRLVCRAFVRECERLPSHLGNARRAISSSGVFRDRQRSGKGQVLAHRSCEDRASIAGTPSRRRAGPGCRRPRERPSDGDIAGIGPVPVRRSARRVSLPGGRLAPAARPRPRPRSSSSRRRPRPRPPKRLVTPVRVTSAMAERPLVQPAP